MVATAAPMAPPAGYAPMLPPPGVVVAVDAGAQVEEAGVGLATLKQWFDAYQETKRHEMAEQREARRYYHGIQWTDEERRTLEGRNQPPITNNRIGLKIDGIVGVVERLRQDPKAQARTQQYAAGAEIGTAVVREILDACQWQSLSSEVAMDLAVDGIGGCERDIATESDGDPTTVPRRVAPETFWYDPRSVKPDFSDARFKGVYKWMDLDAAVELLPDCEDELRSSADRSPAESMGLQDWEKLWYDTRLKRVKIVECWYRHRGKHHWAIFTGSGILKEGASPFLDRRGKTRCRYNMTSANVDQDGDRYGFVRNMKSPQDEINHRRSKLLHILNTNQVLYEDGAVEDPNEAGAQLQKPNGWVKLNPGAGQPGGPRFEIRDQSIQLQGQAELLREAKGEIDNFGPTPALLGSGPASASGRAQAMQQQAGIAQLGPYFGRYRGWKIALYRDLWDDARQFWQNERMIRVAGGDELEFLAINTMVMTPEGPRIANAIGELDLDIVMDEGPDTVTLNEDRMQVFDSMIQKGLIQGPGALPLAVEVMNLPQGMAQKLAAANAPPPADPQAQAMQHQAMQLEMAGAEAKVRKTSAEAERAQAEAMLKMAQAQQPDDGSARMADAMKTAATIEHTQARTREVEARTMGAMLGRLGQPVMTAPAQF